jgi:hypothetical protein
MKYPVAAALFLLGCVPRARSAEEARRSFVRDVTAAVAECAKRGAPATCPEADRLAEAYYAREERR